MLAVLNTLGPRMRLNHFKPSIENIVFKLHYKATVILLLVFVILVCGREYFGEHIRCISDSGVPPHVIQTYCFFMATFTIVRHYNESLLEGGFLPHPGVGPMSNSDEVLHHTYYQWVPFVLFLQAICFYIPHYIWKKKEVGDAGLATLICGVVCDVCQCMFNLTVEVFMDDLRKYGGRIKALVDGLQYASLALCDHDMNVKGMNVPSKKSLEIRLNTIRKDIILRLRISRTWSTWMVSMEVTNLVHVVLQIWLINKFLNGHFLDLGPWVMKQKDWNLIADPLETVFPKVTKCLFHKYGPSGSIQQHDALCVMALNIIHEKIYVILWFWLFFLFVASVLAVVWRICSFYLYRRSLRFNNLMFQQVIGNKFNPYNVITVVNGCQFGDWLFLYYLAKNMNGLVFQELFTRLAEELEKRDMPYDSPMEEKGAEPVLKGYTVTIDDVDEAAPLKDKQKES